MSTEYQQYVFHDRLVSPKNPKYNCKRITKQNIEKFGFNSIEDLLQQYPGFPIRCPNLVATMKDVWNPLIVEYDNNPNRCQHCNDVLRYYQRHLTFCSRSCSATFYNKPRQKQKTIKTISLCRICNQRVRKGLIHDVCKIQPCHICNNNNINIAENKSGMCKDCYLESDVAMEQRGRTFSKTRGYYYLHGVNFYYMSSLELRFFESL